MTNTNERNFYAADWLYIKVQGVAIFDHIIHPYCNIKHKKKYIFVHII